MDLDSCRVFRFCCYHYSAAEKTTWLNKVWRYFLLLLPYFLSLNLMKYGTDKLFLNQFYTPNPNILFTPLGQLSPDILYWSSMGTSPIYSVFAGLIEIIPAIILLFNRTRFVGLLISLLVLINVFFLNLGFDISVKLYTLFLLFITIILLYQYKTSIRQLFKTSNSTLSDGLQQSYTHVISRLISISLILIILLECFGPHLLKSNQFTINAEKIKWYGAYEVKTPSPLRRIHIHNSGYLILESDDQVFTDYKIEVISGNQIILRRAGKRSQLFFYPVNSQTKLHTLKGLLDSDTINLFLRPINLDTLPALKSSFEWFSDKLLFEKTGNQTIALPK
jgi:hypothetical protein